MRNIDEDIKRLENLIGFVGLGCELREIEAQSIKNLLSRLKTAERMNDVLAEHIDNYTYRGGNNSYDIDYGCDFELQTKCICDTSKECVECIKEWARKKVEDE